MNHHVHRWCMPCMSCQTFCLGCAVMLPYFHHTFVTRRLGALQTYVGCHILLHVMPTAPDWSIIVMSSYRWTIMCITDACHACHAEHSTQSVLWCYHTCITDDVDDWCHDCLSQANDTYIDEMYTSIHIMPSDIPKHSSTPSHMWANTDCSAMDQSIHIHIGGFASHWHVLRSNWGLFIWCQILWWRWYVQHRLWNWINPFKCSSLMWHISPWTWFCMCIFGT